MHTCSLAECTTTVFWYLAWWWFSEPKYVDEFVILITDICSGIDWIYYCITGEFFWFHLQQRDLRGKETMGLSETLVTAHEITWCRKLEPSDYELVVYCNKISVSQNMWRRWSEKWWLVNCKYSVCRSSGCLIALEVWVKSVRMSVSTLEFVLRNNVCLVKWEEQGIRSGNETRTDKGKFLERRSWKVFGLARKREENEERGRE